MSTVISLIKFLKPRLIKKSPAVVQPPKCLQYWRGFADKSKSETTSKQTAIQGPEAEVKIRVRRARPADVPRVLRFVRENARIAWPGFVNPHPNFHLILGDYVTRALAQGHSMLAEQQEAKRGWSQIRGLAICTTTCPWDAMMLDKWAKCVRCKRSRQLVHFTAHCLRAPALHNKYQVHNILQVILIVPPDIPRATEIVHMLAKTSIKRGREVGLTVLRFDVTNDPIAKALDNLNLKKEWELSYNLLPDAIREQEEMNRNEEAAHRIEEKDLNFDIEDKEQNKGHFISVYTVTNHTTKI